MRALPQASERLSCEIGMLACWLPKCWTNLKTVPNESNGNYGPVCTGHASKPFKNYVALCTQSGHEPSGRRLTMFWALGWHSPPIPHFYRQGPRPAGPQSLTFIDRAWARPAPQLLTSIGQPLTLLLARPLTSVGQTPHFY